MSENNIKNKNNYKNNFENIKPDDDLINLIKDNVKDSREFDNKLKNKIYFRPVVTGALIVSISLCGVPVMAKGISKVYELMNLVPPEVAKDFVPIELDNINNNNIRLEVISANIEGNTAKLYITLEDLNNNKIIDINSYNLRGLGEASLGLEFYGFEDNKAIYMINITDLKNQDILESISNNIVFEVNELSIENRKFGDMSGESSEQEFKINLDNLDNISNISDIIKENVGIKEIRLTGASGEFEKYLGKNFIDLNYIDVPVENIEPISMGVDNFDIVTATYLEVGEVGEDRFLNMCVRVSTASPDTDYSYLYLKHKTNNNNIMPLYTLGYSNYIYQPTQEEINKEPLVRYTNYIFDISPEELDNYDLYGSGYIQGKTIKTDLKVEFNIRDYINK